MENEETKVDDTQTDVVEEGATVETDTPQESVEVTNEQYNKVMQAINEDPAEIGICEGCS